MLQNVSNSGVGSGDSDGSVGEGCGASCRGGHGVGGDDVGDVVGVVVDTVIVIVDDVAEVFNLVVAAIEKVDGLDVVESAHTTVWINDTEC